MSTDKFPTHSNYNYGASSDPNKKPVRDSLQEVKLQLDKTKDVMHENFEKVIKRGDDLVVLEEKADDLEKQSVIFERKSAKLKCMEKMKLYRNNIIIAFIVILILVIIIVSITKSVR